MSDHIQIFTTADLLQRIAANESAKNLSIYAGHLDETSKSNALYLYITRAPGEDWPDKKISEIRKLKGNYTALFKPGNELMYVSSEMQPMPFNFSLNGMSDQIITPHHNKELKALIADVIRLEKECEDLRAKLKEATDAVRYYEDSGNKFTDVLENIFWRVAPKLAPELKQYQQQQPIQGTMEDWQKIDVNGNSDLHLENAMIVLVEAFGDENILKFARMIQRDPGKVQMLINFL
jgi:hypothetical protein